MLVENIEFSEAYTNVLMGFREGVMNKCKLMTSAAAVLTVCGSSHAALAQSTASGGGYSSGEIIVTAQKREQSINNVGMTIQAASSQALENRGITDVSDLNKLVPGFTATQSLYSTPVYTLRGDCHVNLRRASESPNVKF